MGGLVFSRSVLVQMIEYLDSKHKGHKFYPLILPQEDDGEKKRGGGGEGGKET